LQSEPEYLFHVTHCYTCQLKVFFFFFDVSGKPVRFKVYWCPDQTANHVIFEKWRFVFTLLLAVGREDWFGQDRVDSAYSFSLCFGLDRRIKEVSELGTRGVVDQMSNAFSKRD
jgi:hypothetical protein